MSTRPDPTFGEIAVRWASLTEQPDAELTMEHVLDDVSELWLYSGTKHVSTRRLTWDESTAVLDYGISDIRYLMARVAELEAQLVTR